MLQSRLQEELGAVGEAEDGNVGEGKDGGDGALAAAAAGVVAPSVSVSAWDADPLRVV